MVNDINHPNRARVENITFHLTIALEVDSNEDATLNTVGTYLATVFESRFGRELECCS